MDVHITLVFYMLGHFCNKKEKVDSDVATRDTVHCIVELLSGILTKATLLPSSNPIYIRVFRNFCKNERISPLHWVVSFLCELCVETTQ